MHLSSLTVVETFEKFITSCCGPVRKQALSESVSQSVSLTLLIFVLNRIMGKQKDWKRQYCVFWLRDGSQLPVSSQFGAAQAAPFITEPVHTSMDTKPVSTRDNRGAFRHELATCTVLWKIFLFPVIYRE